MVVYAPMWFKIKMQPQIEFGPKHLFQTLDLLQTFDEVKRVVLPVIQRNAFFAHSENLLLAMIGDEREVLRKLGWRRILKARKDVQEGVVRQFIIPTLKFHCQDYTEVIDWQDTKVTEPPMTMHLSDADITENIRTEKFYLHAQFPNHTQAVERVIKRDRCIFGSL